MLACLHNNILFRARHVHGYNVLAASLAGRQVHTARPSQCALFPNTGAGAIAATTLASITSHLLQSSLQPSSIPTYRRPWKTYNTTICNQPSRACLETRCFTYETLGWATLACTFVTCQHVKLAWEISTVCSFHVSNVSVYMLESNRLHV